MKRQAVLAAAAAIAPSSVIILAGEQSSEGIEGNTDSTISNAGETRYASTVHATVFLLQFVTSEDISDVSEYEEVENNLQELFSPFGIIRNIDIKLLSSFEKLIELEPEPDICRHEDELNNSHPIADETIVCSRGREVKEIHSDEECVVMVTFNDRSAASAAVSAINGE